MIGEPSWTWTGDLWLVKHRNFNLKTKMSFSADLKTFKWLI